MVEWPSDRTEKREFNFVVEYEGDKDSYILTLDELLHDLTIGDLVIHEN